MLSPPVRNQNISLLIIPARTIMLSSPYPRVPIRFTRGYSNL